MKDCRVPRDHLLGLDVEIKTGGGGFKGLMQTFNMTRPGAGAGGLTHDTLVEKSFRDSRIADIWEGTGEINRLVIARGVLNYSSTDLM